MVRFRMVGRDINANPTQYRVWVVDNTPDFTGEFYTGLKSGENPFVDVSAYAITDPTAVVDFNLPQPDRWVPFEREISADFPIRAVLPDPIEDSHLAIIDGYAYMFGGKVTNKIYRADINNPANWIDTGSTMPTVIYGAQLAIIDTNIYLFGGNKSDGYTADGYDLLDTIYSAPLSDPLTWTNLGSHLPRRLCYSSLGISDGYLHLFGGQDPGGATDVIMSSRYVAPTIWVESGALPEKRYGSSLAQIGGSWYLFGGLSASQQPTSGIWKSSINTPTIWNVVGNLPYATAFTQFLAKGNDGYLIGPLSRSPFTGFTPIMECSLLTPIFWKNRGFMVPGVISHCQMAIINDRFWLFGGSGSSLMFTCNQKLKYDYNSAQAVQYGQATRIEMQLTDNLHSPYQALCLPYWITDYSF